MLHRECVINLLSYRPLAKEASVRSSLHAKRDVQALTFLLTYPIIIMTMMTATVATFDSPSSSPHPIRHLKVRMVWFNRAASSKC